MMLVKVFSNCWRLLPLKPDLKFTSENSYFFLLHFFFIIYYMEIRAINTKCWHTNVRVIAYLRKVKAVINMPGTGSEESLAIANIINKHLAQICTRSLSINLCQKFMWFSNSLPVIHSAGTLFRKCSSQTGETVRYLSRSHVWSCHRRADSTVIKNVV